MDNNCYRCDTDAHVCGGCGSPVAHSEGACTQCRKDFDL